MTTLSDYRDAIDLLVPGDHPVASATLTSMKNDAVGNAMDEHSKHRPLVVVEDEDGDDGFDYALTDLASWADDFSIIKQVEYPVDDDDEDEDVLEEADWKIYEKPSGKFLRFISDTPDTGESLRVTYTARHTCTVSECSVSAGDEKAVQSLAAAHFCLMLASAYALDQDSTISADVVDHKNRATVYLNLEKRYRGRYNAHMGIVDGKPKPASHIQDQDVNYPDGTDRITHPRRRR